jgi:hypothetical protein
VISISLESANHASANTMNGLQIAITISEESPNRRTTFGGIERGQMTSLEQFIAGLQFLSSWLTSVLVVLALLLSVFVSLALLEFVFGRNSIARAYTVRVHAFDEENPSDSTHEENPL